MIFDLAVSEGAMNNGYLTLQVFDSTNYELLCQLSVLQVMTNAWI